MVVTTKAILFTRKIGNNFRAFLSVLSSVDSSSQAQITDHPGSSRRFYAGNVRSNSL